MRIFETYRWWLDNLKQSDGIGEVAIILFLLLTYCVSLVGLFGMYVFIWFVDAKIAIALTAIICALFVAFRKKI